MTGLVLVALLGVLAVIQITRPADWQEALNAYVEHASRDRTVTILSIERARYPASFGEESGRAVFGNEVYSLRTLPFPPDRVRCVLVRNEQNGNWPRRQVLFVALHTDLHYADWVVHEGESEPFSLQFLASLAAIGCDLGLGTPSP